MHPHAAEHERERGLEAGDPEGGLIELNVLPHRRMRRVVGGDRVDRPVRKPLPQRSDIGAGAKRRIDLCRRVIRHALQRLVRDLPGERARAGDPLVGHREVVRRHVARDRSALGLGAPHELDRSGGREMREVQSRAGHPREGDIASNCRFLGGRGHPGQPEPRGDRALMHHAFGRERHILGMFDDRAADHTGVLERTAEEAGILYRRSVVGEGDRSGGRKLDEIGELTSLPAASDRRDRQHPRSAGRAAPRDELGDEARRVDRGLGIGHGADGGKAATQRGLRPCRDRFGILEPRFAEVRMKIDESRHDQVALCLERAPVERHAPSPSAMPLPVGVGAPGAGAPDGVGAPGGRAPDRAGAPASRYRSAIRTATPFVTCVSISELTPCATAASISTPSFIGPGCITGAPGRIRSTRSAVRPQTREYSRSDGRSPDS